MRVSLTLIVFAACLALCACADSSPSSCSATVTFKARTDSSWYVGATHYQIYDLTATNGGTCPLTSIVATFALAAGGFISESWNYASASGTFSGYGGALNAGQSFYGAGFVLANSSMLTLNVTRAGCPSSCSSAPTTMAPSTSAPTTSQPSTSKPTSNPSTAKPTSNPSTAAPSTTAPKTCTVTASVMRDSYWWMDSQGRNNSVYRLSITNAGPCALQSYTLSFNIGAGTMLSYWNLQIATGGYQVTGYGPTLQAGASFSAAGMILANAPDHITITLYGSSCAC